MHRVAVLSPCCRYRYALTRRWGQGEAVLWVMLNPSTADAEHDDATLRRIVAYSQAWGYRALTVVNLYAYRAARPRDMFAAADPVGSANDTHISRAAAEHTRIVAAWGAHARADRIAAVLNLPGMQNLNALALTASGQPRHPLYLPGGLFPRPWAPNAAIASARAAVGAHVAVSPSRPC
jgi:hypothetical protein